MKDRSQFWKPQTPTYRFLAEAKRLWELETSRGPRLTTIQSGALLNIIYNMQSMDKLGMTYTLQAVAMAHSLKLFDELNPALSERTRTSYSFTAWSLYNWTRYVEIGDFFTLSATGHIDLFSHLLVVYNNIISCYLQSSRSRRILRFPMST